MHARACTEHTTCARICIHPQPCTQMCYTRICTLVKTRMHAVHMTFQQIQVKAGWKSRTGRPSSVPGGLGDSSVGAGFGLGLGFPPCTAAHKPPPSKILSTPFVSLPLARIPNSFFILPQAGIKLCWFWDGSELLLPSASTRACLRAYARLWTLQNYPYRQAYFARCM